MFENHTEKEQNLPRHIAIILDGNGRWAKKKRMPRNYGHAQGAKTVEKITEAAAQMGISYLTVYAFSTENWKRSKDEVDGLMKLLRSYLKDCLKTCSKNNMKVKIIGDVSRLNPDIQERIKELEQESENNTGIHFQVALNYGGRDDIIRAVKKIISVSDNKDFLENEITEENFSNYLDTKGIPDPDLLIRTSGEMRLSNFLLWQLAYTEIYCTDVLWPDFTKEDLKKAIDYYAGRERRYGGV